MRTPDSHTISLHIRFNFILLVQTGKPYITPSPSFDSRGDGISCCLSKFPQQLVYKYHAIYHCYVGTPLISPHILWALWTRATLDPSQHIAETVKVVIEWMDEWKKKCMGGKQANKGPMLGMISLDCNLIFSWGTNYKGMWVWVYNSL